MSRRRIDLVVRGAIVLAARPGGLETAEAIGIAGSRVVSAGSAAEVLTEAPGARLVDAGDAAVIPGLHDFHIHLAALARSRRGVQLDDARDAGEIADRLRRAVEAQPEGWITGRGWSEAQLAGGVELLEAAVAGRPAFLTSHDGHSAWASAVARGLAELDTATADPPGGRIERDGHGEPIGILREMALNFVAPLVTRLQGDALRASLAETLTELAALGITGASEAGDYTDENGIGADAAFGDSFSTLTDLGDLIDGRLRLNLGIPADALSAAAARGLRTGAALDRRETMRFGWAKEYADGALGSGTAALFEPRSCADGGTGILRVSRDQLDDLFRRARPAGIGLAIHAIGDRAAAEVLDAVGRAEPRASAVPSDRIEHAQLLRRADAARLGALGLVASIQPIHAAADRDLADACWEGRDRLGGAYAWRRLADGGALLAAGSDAPVESFNPWLGVFAAVHRRFPADDRADWRADQALSLAEALSAYTLGPASAIGASDEGHLHPGARADLAVLSVGIEDLQRGDDALGEVRAQLTLVGGREVFAA